MEKYEVQKAIVDFWDSRIRTLMHKLVLVILIWLICLLLFNSIALQRLDILLHCWALVMVLTLFGKIADASSKRDKAFRKYIKTVRLRAHMDRIYG